MEDYLKCRFKGAREQLLAATKCIVLKRDVKEEQMPAFALKSGFPDGSDEISLHSQTGCVLFQKNSKKKTKAEKCRKRVRRLRNNLKCFYEARSCLQNSLD